MTPARAAAAALALASLAAAPCAGAADGTRVYAFNAFLDGKPIGEHRFTVVTDGATRRVTSDADFTVRFLGFSAFHYRHHADERWTGDCVAALQSSTDDDGKPASVRLVKSGDTNEITTPTGSRAVDGCLMTYAYWNPALRTQSRLLDPETGRVDAVKIERVATARIPVAGQDVEADDWRISGRGAPIDVWVTAQGDWVGLDSLVSDGRRKLSYRLP